LLIKSFGSPQWRHREPDGLAVIIHHHCLNFTHSSTTKTFLPRCFCTKNTGFGAGRCETLSSFNSTSEKLAGRAKLERDEGSFGRRGGPTQQQRGAARVEELIWGTKLWEITAEKRNDVKREINAGVGKATLGRWGPGGDLSLRWTLLLKSGLKDANLCHQLGVTANIN